MKQQQLFEIEVCVNAFRITVEVKATNRKEAENAAICHAALYAVMLQNPKRARNMIN